MCAEKLAQDLKIESDKKLNATSSVQTTWGEHDEIISPVRNLKSKQKTRPEVSSAAAGEALAATVNGLDSDLSNLKMRTIEVNKGTRDLFTQMYDTTSETPGDVNWDDFVAAMVDTGFSVDPCGGSVFTFNNIAAGGRINFHRPHPDPAINPIMLRTMGKRLNKWFGFCKETFVDRVEETV